MQKRSQENSVHVLELERIRDCWQQHAVLGVKSIMMLLTHPAVARY